MRVKVGNEWFECQPGQPIMIELADGDRRNIAQMRPEATRYAIFDDEDGWSVEQKLVWMESGAGGLDPVNLAGSGPLPIEPREG